MRVFMAHRINDDSWLRDERYAWFVDGHAYAATQTRAIPALASCSPEALYDAVWAIMRGAGFGDPDEMPRKPPYPVRRPAQPDPECGG